MRRMEPCVCDPARLVEWGEAVRPQFRLMMIAKMGMRMVDSHFDDAWQDVMLAALERYKVCGSVKGEFDERKVWAWFYGSLLNRIKRPRWQRMQRKEMLDVDATAWSEAGRKGESRETVVARATAAPDVVESAKAGEMVACMEKVVAENLRGLMQKMGTVFIEFTRQGGEDWNELLKSYESVVGKKVNASRARGCLKDVRDRLWAELHAAGLVAESQRPLLETQKGGERRTRVVGV